MCAEDKMDAIQLQIAITTLEINNDMGENEVITHNFSLRNTQSLEEVIRILPEATSEIVAEAIQNLNRQNNS